MEPYLTYGSIVKDASISTLSTPAASHFKVINFIVEKILGVFFKKVYLLSSY